MDELTAVQQVQIGCGVIGALVFLVLAAVNAKHVQWNSSESPETVIVFGTFFSAFLGWFLWKIVIAAVIACGIALFLYLYNKKPTETPPDIISAPPEPPKLPEPDVGGLLRQEIDDIIQEGTEKGFPQEVIDAQVKWKEEQYAHGSNGAARHG
jgi:hypothetical protein